jgi:MFS family permease
MDAALAAQNRPVLLATGATIVTVAPMFLVGAQAVQIDHDLGLGPGPLGIAVSFFFGFTAISTAVLGRAVQRFGVRRSLQVVMGLNAVSLLGTAVSRSVVELAVVLAIGGLANGGVHPAANALLAHGGSQRRLGLALGIKQSAPSAASLVAGLAVPAVALTLGWRWSFVGCALVSVVLIWVARSISPSLSPSPASRSGAPAKFVSGRALLVLAVAACFGSMAGNSLGVFLVDYGVSAAGLAPGLAGVVLAVASVVAVAVRIYCGSLADRSRRASAAVNLALAMVAVGAVGHLLLAAARPWMFVAGSLIAYGVGWGWSGLLHYAVVSLHPAGAARATGLLMTGFATGSFAGPLLLGQVASALNYRSVWLCTTGFSFVAAAVMLVASHALRRLPDDTEIGARASREGLLRAQ